MQVLTTKKKGLCQAIWPNAAEIKLQLNNFFGGTCLTTRCSLMQRERASQPLLARVISPKYLPSEPAEECTHVMSCADITESKPIPLLNPAQDHSWKPRRKVIFSILNRGKLHTNKLKCVISQSQSRRQ